ncbi:MAG: sugar phosphate isomerase/epimerase [Verrucomicrobia bacterium]|nr:sugar phosphate isomerase/epimerase [Verrucomicrobiota bacterium]MCF7708644.1 sugar phosphate isomerase/epimerase [Verrucomicrobiota bacterium]
MNTTGKCNLISRREFTKKLGLGVAAVTTLRSLSGEAVPDKGLVGSNIYGWSQYYGRDGLDVNKHIDEVLTKLEKGGYDYLENFLDWSSPEKNAAFAGKLKDHGMRPVSLYTGGRFHESDSAGENVKRLLDIASVCSDAGFRILVCNPDPIDREKTDKELDTQAAALNELGAGLNKLGMRLGIHHHTPAMENKAREFHWNFKNTDSRYVGFCIDVHWMYRGGMAPMKALEQYGDRVVSWHLRQSRDGVWYEVLAEGDIDFKALAGYQRKHGLPRIFTVELALENDTEITRSAFENHKISRQYVKEVFGV